MTEGIRDVYSRDLYPRLSKLDLTTDAEYVASLVCRYVVVNVQQWSVLHGAYRTPVRSDNMHNDIFTDTG